MKKNIAIILCLAMVISLFAGCIEPTSLTEEEGNYGFGANNFVVTVGQSSGGSGDSTNTPDSIDHPGTTVVPEDTAGDITITGVENVKTVSMLTMSEFSQPTYQKLTGHGLNYCLYAPSDYATRKYPIILFLHGIGSTLNSSNAHATTDAMVNFFTYNGDIVKKAIIVSPQATNSDALWGSQDDHSDATNAFAILEDVASAYNADMNRVYIVGTSMGGIGTWYQLLQHPTYFAAAVPTAGRNADAYNSPETLINIPIWGWHGTEDKDISFSGGSLSVGVDYNGANATPKLYERIVAAAQSAGVEKKMNFTSVTNGDHASAWNRGFDDRGLVSWLFSQEIGKYQDDHYEMMPYIRVVNSKGKIIITEKDAASAYHAANGADNTKGNLGLRLTDDAKAKLSAAYAEATSNDPFTVYFGTQAIMTFTVSDSTTAVGTGDFVIRGAFPYANTDIQLFYTRKVQRTAGMNSSYNQTLRYTNNWQ